MQNVIDKIELTFAALDGFLGWFFGDLDGFLYALIIFVVMDYFTGILAAGVKKELSSAVGFKGIAKNASPFTNLTYGVDGCNEPMFRIGYNTPLYTYTDERSAKAEP